MRIELVEIIVVGSLIIVISILGLFFLKIKNKSFSKAIRKIMNFLEYILGSV